MADLDSIPAFGTDFFSRLSCTSDLEMGNPMATLPDTRHDRVSSETGWLGVSIL